MNPIFALLNGPEIIAILAIILVLFGAKKLPELARGLGQGIKEFKKSSREIQDELNEAIDLNAPPPPPRREQQVLPAQATPVLPAQATPQDINVTSPASAVTPTTPPQQPKV
jgi:sec-independent protein translocase protein TatA